jgi:hypothetical protein
VCIVNNLVQTGYQTTKPNQIGTPKIKKGKSTTHERERERALNNLVQTGYHKTKPNR